MMNTLATENQEQLSAEQIEYLTALHFINPIDEHMRIVSNINILPGTAAFPPRVLLVLEILYNDQYIDSLSFNLRNYSFDEIVDIARNIRSNEYILHEVDNFLAGDIE